MCSTHLASPNRQTQLLIEILVERVFSWWALMQNILNTQKRKIEALKRICIPNPTEYIPLTMKHKTYVEYRKKTRELRSKIQRKVCKWSIHEWVVHVTRIEFVSSEFPLSVFNFDYFFVSWCLGSTICLQLLQLSMHVFMLVTHFASTLFGVWTIYFFSRRFSSFQNYKKMFGKLSDDSDYMR